MEHRKYPAIIRKEWSGIYCATFPDLNSSVWGETVEDAKDLASDFLPAFIRMAGSPAASDLDKIRGMSEEGDIVVLVEEGCSGNPRFADWEGF